MITIYRTRKRLIVEIDIKNWQANIARYRTKSGNYDVSLDILPKKDGFLHKASQLEGELIYEEISREKWLSLERMYKRERNLNRLIEREYQRMISGKWAEC